MSSISGECRIGSRIRRHSLKRFQPRIGSSARTRMSRAGAGKCGRQHQSHRHHQHRKLRQFWVDHHDWSAAGRSETGNPLRQNALDPGFHGVRMVRRMRTVMLMVPTWPESGFLERAARLRPTTRGGRGGERGFSVGKGKAEGRDDGWRLRGRRCRSARVYIRIAVRRRPERSTFRAPSEGEVYIRIAGRRNRGVRL